MKRRVIAFILISMFALPVLYSQDKGKFGFGVLGGVNFQNINGKDASGDKLENGLIIGFHGGVKLEIPLVPDFYIQPGLLFSTKGANVNPDGDPLKHKLSYLELPVNFVYKGLLGSGHVMLGFGPYAGYGIAGNVVNDDGDKTKITFSNEVELAEVMDPTYRPFDMGANIFFGYQLEMGMFFQFNAQLGLIKINPDYKPLNPEDLAWKNTGFGVSVGYMF
jgi:hypothetical protein